jgi:hypothetical protein
MNKIHTTQSNCSVSNVPQSTKLGKNIQENLIVLYRHELMLEENIKL